MSYIFAKQVGNRIFHRYIDTDGLIQNEVVKSFPIELYIQSNKRIDSNGLMGENLSKIEFDDIADASGFYREYKDIQEIYGQNNFLYQFLSKRYPDNIQFDIHKIPIMIIDLECAYDDSGFPHASKAKQEILTIACKVIGASDDNYHFVVFGSKPFTGSDDIEYVQCRDEKDLLIKFQEYWIKINPAIVTGWNVKTFDMPYIINRCDNIMNEGFSNKFSCFSKNLTKCISHQEVGDKDVSVEIVGVTVLDYLDLYKKFSTENLESYRLEIVAQHELNEGKIDHEEYDGLMGLYNDNYDLFVSYNKKDIELIERFEKKLNYIFLALTLAYLGKVCFDDIFGQVRFWDMYIYNELQKKNIQIPPIKQKGHDNIVGGFVKEPIPALYEWIVTMDLTSLYPSIIRTFNLSPETLVKPWEHSVNDIEAYIDMTRDLSFAKEQNVAVLGNGSTYSREKMGIFNELVSDMFAKRKDYKKKAGIAFKELEEIKLEMKKRGIQ
jgi:DNA polymerase elongation subunit (family B)